MNKIIKMFEQHRAVRYFCQYDEIFDNMTETFFHNAPIFCINPSGIRTGRLRNKET